MTTVLQDAETRCNRKSVEVFDLQSSDVLALVVDPDFEQIAVFRLHEEEEGALIVSVAVYLSLLTLILCMTPVTIRFPRLLSPFWTSGLRLRGMGIR